MRTVTNSEVASIVDRGGSAQNGRGSFYGSPVSAFFSADRGWMPRIHAFYREGSHTVHLPETRSLGRELDKVAEKFGGYQAVIFSYATPVALKIDDVWIIPDVRYSATTSTKHQSQLWKLNGRYIPADATAEDIENVLKGYVEYGSRTKRFYRGWNMRQETAQYYDKLAARESATLAEAVAA